MPDDEFLREVLSGIQLRGAIGDVALPDAIAHADQFVVALPQNVHRLADLGSGGGLPGLVIAVRRPDVAVTLVERRRTRADLLERGVSALDLGDRVRVFAGDVRQLAASEPRSFQAVTARSFAGPEITAGWAGKLLQPGGILVVSEPPGDTMRWTGDVLAAAKLQDLGRMGGVRRFSRLP